MKPLHLSEVSMEETRSPEAEPPPIDWIHASDADKRKAWRRFWLLEPLLGGVNYLSHHALRLLPVSACSAVGAALAPLARRRFSGEDFVQRIADNMRQLRPDLAQADGDLQLALARWWDNVGRVYAEFSTYGRHYKSGLVEVSGKQRLTSFLTAGRQVIFVSTHVGHWEAQVAILGEEFAKSIVGPFQPEPSRFTNRLLHELRRRRGQYLFPPGRKSALLLRRMLMNEQTMGLFYLDDVRAGQIHFPLFGRKTPDAGNAHAAIKLAMATGAIIVPVFLIRKGGASYELRLLEPVEPMQQDNRQAAIAQTISLLNDAMEPVVRAHIDQWYMLAALQLGESGLDGVVKEQQ